jgi:hypothetical protein
MTATVSNIGAALATRELLEHRWHLIQDGYAYVASRRALVVEGESWRVERHASGDIVITLPSPDGRR